jgi:predicted transcriptional regulator of viral defense system
MADEHADKSGYQARSGDLAELLRAGHLGAFFRPGQAADAGLTRQQLRTLVRRGAVERVGRGLYRVAGAEPTENYSIAMACARVPNSVVCLLSALGVHQIGTQLPRAVWLAIRHKARMPQLAGVTLRVVRFSGAAWTYGVTKTEFEGVPARITSPARTIVDCFRYERLIGPEAAMEALLDGLRRRVVTVGELDRAERVLPSRRLRAALDLRSTGAL